MDAKRCDIAKVGAGTIIKSSESVGCQKGKGRVAIQVLMDTV
jgi:hypothetical protein